MTMTMFEDLDAVLAAAISIAAVGDAFGCQIKLIVVFVCRMTAIENIQCRRSQLHWQINFIHGNNFCTTQWTCFTSK